MGQITDVVKHLLIINVLIYFAAVTLLPNMGISPNILALSFPGKSDDFQAFQLVTHMFMHGGTQHLLFNMLTLFFLGPTVERALGAKDFLTLYLLSGLGSLLLHLGLGFAGLIYPANIVGASGAIMGVVCMFALLYPNMKLMLLFPPIPVKAKYLVMAYIAFDLFSGVSGRASGIAHWAHLGGALAGFLFYLYWKNSNSRA